MAEVFPEEGQPYRIAAYLEHQLKEDFGRCKVSFKVNPETVVVSSLQIPFLNFLDIYAVDSNHLGKGIADICEVKVVNWD